MRVGVRCAQVPVRALWSLTRRVNMADVGAKRAAQPSADVVPEPRGPVDQLDITPLGAGSEVGRSCILLSYKGKNVMLDCGIHPGLSGMASLPYFDDVDLSTACAHTARTQRPPARLQSALRRVAL